MYIPWQWRLLELVTEEESLRWLRAPMGVEMVRAQVWEGRWVCCSHFSTINKQAERDLV